MSKNRLTKKDLQTDELQHALVDASEYVASHKDQSLRFGLIAGGVIVLVVAVWLGLGWRSARLGARLSSALAVLDAPLVTDGVTPAAGQTVYKTADERLAELKKQLKQLADESPSSIAGRSAALMLLSLEGGKSTPAQLDSVRALAGKKTFEGSFAALAALESQAAAGQVKEAIATGKKYLDSGSSIPKDYLLFTLATLNVKAGQISEAKTFYNRVISDFPESPLKFEAQQKLAEL